MRSQSRWSIRRCFSACYGAALERNGYAEGRVQLRFSIDAAGNVSKPCIEPPVLQDGAAVRCVIECFEKLQFGSGNPTTVVYPILFVHETGPDPSFDGEDDDIDE